MNITYSICQSLNGACSINIKKTVSFLADLTKMSQNEKTVISKYIIWNYVDDVGILPSLNSSSWPKIQFIILKNEKLSHFNRFEELS